GPVTVFLSRGTEPPPTSVPQTALQAAWAEPRLRKVQPAVAPALVVPRERVHDLDGPGRDALAQDALEDRAVQLLDGLHAVGGHQQVHAALVAQRHAAPAAVG